MHYGAFTCNYWELPVSILRVIITTVQMINQMKEVIK